MYYDCMYVSTRREYWEYGICIMYACIMYVCAAFEVFYMYLVYTPDGIVLVRRYYITCLNLLFSNRRGQTYI